jgi:tetrapyrrole methylase family protein/MazG family protein
MKGLTDKMVHRHPHVFAPEAETVKGWDTLKQEEKGKDVRTSLLSGIAKSLPPLSKAYELQKRASKAGFDWDNPADIWAKLDEEIAEVKEAIQANDLEEMTKEFGDVLFVLANLTRYYKINTAFALETSNRKFNRRFHYIEEKLASQGKNLQDTDLKEMDQYWDEAKGRE